MSRWNDLTKYTQARVGLGQSGSCLPTDQHLRIQEAQALSRDALYKVWDPTSLLKYLEQRSVPSTLSSTLATDRTTYLARPDLGRNISPEEAKRLASLATFKACDRRIVFCISDGLSAESVDKHIEPFLEVFLGRLEKSPLYQNRPYPFVILPFARVAAADLVGAALGAEASVIFVGERPGLSSHDSLGVYLTYAPRAGNADSGRNCISNIRPPLGHSYQNAAAQLMFLLEESLRLKLSGVSLKMQELLTEKKI